jgi:hypothetical protein
MPPLAVEVIVTDHALERWRERAAVYGDETVADVQRAFEQAVELETPPYPMKPYPGRAYFGLPSLRVIFVCERQRNRLRVMTVRPEPVSKNIEPDDRLYVLWTRHNTRRKRSAWINRLPQIMSANLRKQERVAVARGLETLLLPDGERPPPDSLPVPKLIAEQWALWVRWPGQPWKVIYEGTRQQCRCRRPCKDVREIAQVQILPRGEEPRP